MLKGTRMGQKRDKRGQHYIPSPHFWKIPQLPLAQVLTGVLLVLTFRYTNGQKAISDLVNSLQLESPTFRTAIKWRSYPNLEVTLFLLSRSCDVITLFHLRNNS